MVVGCADVDEYPVLVCGVAVFWCGRLEGDIGVAGVHENIMGARKAPVPASVVAAYGECVAAVRHAGIGVGEQ